MVLDPHDGAPPESVRPHSAERLLVELRFELDHALRLLEVRTNEARAAADEAETATLHALRTEIELQGIRRLLSRLRERIEVLHERARGTDLEPDLLDVRTILEIHTPDGADD